MKAEEYPDSIKVLKDLKRYAKDRMYIGDTDDGWFAPYGFEVVDTPYEA